MQMVFQDPYGSLNPRMTIGEILAMPLRFHAKDLDAQGRRHKAEEALHTVGLPAQYLDRYPHEFSGGQRQRIGIARALTLEPEFIMADEPVSALDVSVQAQVLNLFSRIRQQMHLTMLFVTHDLAVVGHIADRVAVMYLGRIVEVAPTREQFSHPRHPYTEALMSAIPMPNPGQRRQRIVLQGDIPSPISPPSGCAFHTRCPYVLPACSQARPALRLIGPEHATACIRDDLSLISPLHEQRETLCEPPRRESAV
jgi:oligopeptide/dipeptide ABC transporter ATP-binding protein